MLIYYLNRGFYPVYYPSLQLLIKEIRFRTLSKMSHLIAEDLSKLKVHQRQLRLEKKKYTRRRHVQILSS